MAPTLGYWSLRGLAEPIRYVLAYTGTDYQEKLYHIGPGPEFDREEWVSAKPNLGLDFPNLPYWIDGDLKISESSAILKHLARKNGLVGSTEEERIWIDVAQGVLLDLFRATVMLVYGDDCKEKKPAFDAAIDEPLGKCAKLLKGDYVTGDKISYADFLLYEQLERYEMLLPGAVARYPALLAFQQRIAALPAIAAYRKSEGFQKIKTRFFGRMCKIGHGEESY